jgi:hypothetical protein
VLAAILSAPPSAGAQAPASKPIQPASPPAVTTTAAGQPAATAKKTAKRASGKRPSTADARVCLEFPNEMQVVKCSEKYRWEQAASE